MTETERKALSKALSWLLRHEAQRVGLLLDGEGYAALPDVIQHLADHAGLRASEEQIREVVQHGESEKQRFSMIEGCIRANYGHTLEAGVSHPNATPPAILYHGTSNPSLDRIRAEGLRPMRRQYVHLTTDRSLATSIGQRHGPPLVLEIDALTAHKEGTEFYQANPRFWLVRSLPSRYIRFS